MNAFQEMVRARLRQKIDNASTLARFLKENPSTVTKRLKEGGPSLTLEFLDQLREFFAGWTPAEMVAEPGSEIVPIKPIEASLLGHFRQMTELERHSLMVVLQSRTPAYVTGQGRTARLGRARLTPKEQELVDLFGQVKKDAVREGVLKMLRGAAEDDDEAGQGKRRTSG